MRQRLVLSCALVALSIIAASAWGGRVSAGAPPAETYPAPRYPRYLVKPTKDQLLRAARFAVRQTGGRVPLGQERSGQKVHVLFDHGQDLEVWEAIRTAWAERGVEGIGVQMWDWMGMPRAELEAQAKANLLFGKDGWKEIGNFEPLYAAYFPPAIQKEFGKPLTHFVQIYAVTPYLQKHPEVQAYYWAVGGGGPSGWLGGETLKYANRFRGNWTYNTKTDLVAKSTEFPGDVWALVEDRIEKPKPFTTEGTFVDPEGTRLRWVMTREQAQAWADGRSNPLAPPPTQPAGKVAGGAGNHLNVYPAALGATWKEGVLRASSNHTGYYPTMTVTLSEHGRVVKVEGGGRNGEYFRMLVEHPKFKNAKYPGAPETGYWHVMQDGFAINPKYVRDVERLVLGSNNYTNLSERERAGVQHFSFCSPVGGSAAEPEAAAWAKAAGIPLKHTAHMHVYFGTVKWKLADTGEWISIAEKGQVTALQSPEVRALASRYGDADDVLRYEWIPEIPGINAPGDYGRDYGSDPWKWIMGEWTRIQNGTYGHYVEDYQMRGGVATK